MADPCARDFGSNGTEDLSGVAYNDEPAIGIMDAPKVITLWRNAAERERKPEGAVRRNTNDRIIRKSDKAPVAISNVAQAYANVESQLCPVNAVRRPVERTHRAVFEHWITEVAAGCHPHTISIRNSLVIRK